MKYALRNLVRMPMRTVLTFILLFLILFLSMFGLFVTALCEEVRQRSSGPLDGTVVVTDKDGYAMMYYTVARDIAEHCDAIEHIYAVSEKQVWFEDLDYIGEAAVYDYSGTTDCTQGFKLSSVTSMDVCREWYSGEIEMISGTPLTESDNESRLLKCVVSDRLAEKNGLSLGSTVTLSVMSIFTNETGGSLHGGSNQLFISTKRLDGLDDPAISEDVYKLKMTVGGIYHNNIDNSITASVPYLNNDNRIYVPISVVAETLDDMRSNKNTEISALFTVLGRSIDLPTVSAKNFMLGVTTLNYRLKDPAYAVGVEKMLNSLGLKSEVMLTGFVADASTSPAAKLMSVVKIAMICVVAAGAVILVVVLLFNMTVRKRELSVLAALGKRRVRIALSFFAEVLVIFIAALIICTLVFGLAVKGAAKPLSQYLEASESSVRYENREATDVIVGNEAETKREAKLLNFGYLLSVYIAPQSAATAIVSSAVVVFTFVLIALFIYKTDVLTSLAGKQ